MGRGTGFSLIEIVVVMAVIAIALVLTGPSIGAGISRIELNQAAQSTQRYIKVARLQAQRSQQEQYVILDPDRHSVAILNEALQITREEKLPNSVQVVLEAGSQIAAVYVAPSGAVRGNTLRLLGR